MRTITKEKAKLIASEWHGGQWSALYQYSSSCEFVKENALDYINECVGCKQPGKIELHKYDILKLDMLIRYFIKEAAKHDITIKFTKYDGHEILWVVIPEMEEKNEKENN